MLAIEITQKSGICAALHPEATRCRAFKPLPPACFIAVVRSADGCN